MNCCRVIFWVAALALLCGCDADPKTDAARKQTADPVVARVGKWEITAANLQAEWARRQPLSEAVPSAEAAHTLLGTLVREKTWLVRAQAAGWEQEPETRRLIEQLIVSRFLAAEMARRETNAGTPTTAELQAWYDARADRWVEAAAWRAGVIWLRQSAKAGAEQRAALRARAAELRHQAEQADAAAFTALVQQHSEHQATRYRGGDTGWWSVGQPALLEDTVMEAVASLATVGAVAPLVETPEGLYIVRLVAQRPSRRRPMSEVRAVLEYEWQQQQRQQREAELFAELARGVTIEVDRQALGRAFPTNPTAARAQPQLPKSGSF